MIEYRDTWYSSADGLRLYARDYPCAAGDAAPVVLCMHGLTRNSADFAQLAPHLAQRFRVLAVDVRGRGNSDYDSNPDNYTPLTYAQDMFALLDFLDIQRAILCGTSMGGLMAMLMAATQPARVAGIILNDIGPEVDPRGLQRIQEYVGKAPPVIDWAGAIAQVQEVNGEALPDFSPAQWEAMARALYREVDGVPVPAYDPAIAQPVDAGGAVPPDLWPLFAMIASLPILVIRGAHSDILAPQCVDTMRERKPDLLVAQIPGRGHAPTLDEAQSRIAIDAFLEQFASA
ncbi:alpha/beta hydrolase [Mangrovimicrobium sediminis]|uniref:Alpha/beta hydrolase n=1 Tax=Mangrovimicrobium sediminis TaxID=2562682 RepID=A0A4Z0M912_9GAMM|nr:alpha/beta hydrolase [Haliea sp. SAOS-164]TGD75785.1 alpha/beta hydrolase [Haliea sp. SAOS-164]